MTIFRFKLVILLTVTGVGILSFFLNTQAADCQLLATAWGKQTTSVNEPIAFSITGQNCKDWEVSIVFYEDRTFKDYLIKTIKKTFINDRTLATAVTFTRQDYIDAGNESENEQVYFEAVAGTSTIKSKNLILKEPVAGTCQLSKAKWEWKFCNSPIEGSPVHLVIEGTGCPNFVALAHVYERDVGGDDAIVTLNAKFDSQGRRAEVKWDVEGASDDDKIGSYDFYFDVAAGADRIQSDTLIIPLRSKSGCTNCNALVPPNTCECSDGFSKKRELLESCENICKNHLGDSHKDFCGTGDKISPPDSGTIASGSKTEVRNISFKNPIANDDLISLIKAVTNWITRLAVPVAVIVIIIAGVMFMAAQGKPDKVKQARQMLTYAVIGLAVILIGRGFYTLIKSILDLGAK